MASRIFTQSSSVPLKLIFPSGALRTVKGFAPWVARKTCGTTCEPWFAVMAVAMASCKGVAVNAP